MLSFLGIHMGTILVGSLVFAGLAGSLMYLIRNKRKGHCVGCDSGCGGCHSQSVCNEKKSTIY